MKLVTNETAVYDYTNGTVDSIYTVYAESRGNGRIPRLIDCFRDSQYQRIRVITDEDEYLPSHTLVSALLGDCKRRKVTDCYAYMKHDKVYLEKIRSAKYGQSNTEAENT